MQFLDNFNHTWEIISMEVHGELNSLRTSLQSDIPTEVSLSGEVLRNSYDALSVLLVLPFLGGSRNYFQIQRIRDTLGKMAHNYSYQGNWNVVGEILEQTDSLDIRSTWIIIFKNINENDWYGNYVPRILRAIKGLKVTKVYSFVSEDTRPVKQPQRKRGYNDKGSQRLSHQWLPSEYQPVGVKISQKLIKEPISLFWFWRYLRRGSGH